MLRKAPSLGHDIDNVSSWLVLALVLSIVDIRPLEKGRLVRVWDFLYFLAGGTRGVSNDFGRRRIGDLAVVKPERNAV